MNTGLIRPMLAVALAASLGGCQKAAPGPDPVTGGNPAQGQRLVSDYGCVACHTVGGLRAERGLVGPPLTGIKQRAIIGGSLPNTPQNIEQWIMHPQQYNANTAMPDLGVTQAQARDIAAFLYSQ